LVTVARILRSEGREGKLRVRFAYIKPADCTDLSRVFIGKEGGLKEYKVESLVPKGKDFNLKVKGVDSLSEADRLEGADLAVLEECLRKRSQDEFFLFQLIGCAVLDKEGRPAGQVVDVLSVGGGELLVLERCGKEIFIPFHESICIEVDVAAKRILIDPPEGLLDLNEI
jgi:16S rRNA processing protein RimM